MVGLAKHLPHGALCRRGVGCQMPLFRSCDGHKRSVFENPFVPCPGTGLGAPPLTLGQWLPCCARGTIGPRGPPRRPMSKKHKGGQFRPPSFPRISVAARLKPHRLPTFEDPLQAKIETICLIWFVYVVQRILAMLSRTLCDTDCNNVYCGSFNCHCDLGHHIGVFSQATANFSQLLCSHESRHGYVQFFL